MRHWFGRLSYRWDWLQVEVSSQCHASCVYCPTAIYRQNNSNLLMEMETFQKLVPAFSQTRLVYLQGWGEPFLNPHFFEMVRMAKTAGCQVGMTTNGMFVNDDKLLEIANSGVDIVTLSLAGCLETNDAIRKGTRLAQVLKITQRLKQLKEQNGRTGPDVHIAYMLLRSGLEEVEQLPRLLEGSGVSQVVISTLDFIPSPNLEAEALIPSSQEEYTGLRARLDGVVAAGKRSGIDIYYQLVAPGNNEIVDANSTPGELDFTVLLPVSQPSCTENIQRSAFVSASGDVSPCVFTHLPVKSAEELASKMGKLYQPMIFGNVHEHPLEAIWQSKGYRAFRHSHRAHALQANCRCCLKPRVQIL